ncbi:hypothetical protein [Streptomyces sp. NPDC048516]|uniref:hypothetical protein n=1 Tax=Streptomyces sp. NPDC048516 TaxID=3365565 RepID=UPI0037191147
MEEPMSGPEPGAPVEAAPAEPVPSGEQQEGNAVASAAGAAPAGDVQPQPQPQPVGVGTTPTGEAAVDTTLRRLADADHLPASGHLQVYEDVHRGLRDVLAGLDQHPGPPAPSPTTHDKTHDNRS